MGYLYGDATPFPLDENFIETLSAITDACVALYRSEAARDRRQREASSARERADAELARVAELGQAIQRTLTPFVRSGATSEAAAAAANLGKSAQATLKHAVDTINQRRDTVVRQAAAVNVADEVRRACEAFFVHHQLPHTRWDAEWIVTPGSETVTLTMTGIGPEHIVVTMDGAVPASSRWAGPIKVSDLEADLTISLSKEPGLLGKNTRKEALHRMVLTRVLHTDGELSVELHGSAKKASSGLRIVFGAGDEREPVVSRIDAGGNIEGPSESLGGESEAAARMLQRHLIGMVAQLPGMRATLRSLRFGPRAVKDSDEPQKLAEAMLASIAPIVLEMRKRSRVPGELALKRDLGDGRREELFVPREELARRYEGLDDHHRRAFEAIGLSGESTSEFMTTMLRPAAAAGGMDLDEALSSASRDSTVSDEPDPA